MDLTGKCLIARPSIVDPFFAKSVVFVYEHTMKGTAGVIINKKLSKTTKDLLMNKGFDANVPGETLFAGGPVNERAVVMLHSADWTSSNTLHVTSNISVTSDDIMLFRYAQGDTPRHYKFCCGASIWHPQQMKSEINRNNWLIVDLDVETIFETHPVNLWDIAVEQTATETMDKFI
jgi:putative transcriptional regulator